MSFCMSFIWELKYHLQNFWTAPSAKVYKAYCLDSKQSRNTKKSDQMLREKTIQNIT